MCVQSTCLSYVTEYLHILVLNPLIIWYKIGIRNSYVITDSPHNGYNLTRLLVHQQPSVPSQVFSIFVEFRNAEIVLPSGGGA